MLNRREFLERGSIVALATSIPFGLKADIIEQQTKVFERVFEPVQFAPGQTPEFPLDFIWPGEQREYVAYVKVLNKTDKMHNADYILVPTPFNNKNKAIDYDYGTTLLSAGIDRNILVYDEKCSGNYVSKRLQALLSSVIRRNYGRKTKNRLTDIFIHESKFVENLSDKIRVHRVGTEVWNKILNDYAEFADVCKYNKHLNNKTNLVIGVSTVMQEFVKPIMSNGNHGIAVLDNRNVIFGVY